MKKTNDIIAYVTASLAAVTFLMVSSCGDKEVTPGMLLDSPEDYVGERVQVPGKVTGMFKHRNGTIYIELEALEETLVSYVYWGKRGTTTGYAEIHCYFPLNAPPPGYLDYGDLIAISGVVRIDPDGDVELIECRIVQ